MRPSHSFHPATDVVGSGLILEHGEWPNFHDAEVHDLRIWRGDVRPDDNVWIGPVIEASFELCALKDPFMAILKFHDCDAIRMTSFDSRNALYDLLFTLEHRGRLRDGTPMTPWVCVSFTQAFGVRLSFKCSRIEVLGRRRVP
ncbi:MAG: hypothetical protein QNK18_15630 [Gammaproteobacteria bacterium]|nr:hypothetical protein [Gammaproteobacteria bacterium]